MIVIRTANQRFLRWQQWGDASPLRIGQLEGPSGEHLDGREAVTDLLPVSPSGRMTTLGHRLMLTPEARPVEPDDKALGRFSADQALDNQMLKELLGKQW